MDIFFHGLHSLSILIFRKILLANVLKPWQCWHLMLVILSNHHGLVYVIVQHCLHFCRSLLCCLLTGLSRSDHWSKYVLLYLPLSFFISFTFFTSAINVANEFSSGYFFDGDNSNLNPNIQLYVGALSSFSFPFPSSLFPPSFSFFPSFFFSSHLFLIVFFLPRGRRDLQLRHFSPRSSFLVQIHPRNWHWQRYLFSIPAPLAFFPPPTSFKQRSSSSFLAIYLFPSDLQPTSLTL